MDIRYNKALYLPTTVQEIQKKAWDSIDVILFSGDAYVDHPAFGTAVIGRVLESRGYRVAIVPQPNWRDDLRDFKKLGKPRLFFAVTAGAMDSMVNHYTANLRLRSDDAYTPDGKSGFRPDYPTIIYSNILKQLYPDVPIILGGIEASLRRVTHFDFWQNKLLPSQLISSKADILVYGMGEKAIIEIAEALESGKKVSELKDIPQTVVSCFESDLKSNYIRLNSYEDCVKSKLKFTENFKILEIDSNKIQGDTLIEAYKEIYLKINPVNNSVKEKDLDAIYALPFTRYPHPRYKDKRIPAYEMIRHSINIHRGCFGGCSFCTISAHQGKFIYSRSEESVLKELDQVTLMDDFKGYISDVGGPSANMYGMHGKDLSICAKCKRASCIYPSVCKNLNNNHSPLLQLYSKVRMHPKVKKAFIGSGIRYDLFLGENGFLDKSSKEYFETILKHHVSGRLKVAPEHTSDLVLKSIRKPSFSLFQQLKSHFDGYIKKEGLRLQLIPYFISALPHCKLKDMKDLYSITSKMGYRLEQVQSFTPTPMTLASTIYYTGIDPYSGKEVYIAKDKNERQQQQQQFFRWK